MGIKFEVNFIMCAWLFVPALMLATKIFRMDAKDRHSLDMRMKHHSSFWVKGNILVDGIERMVLSQSMEENVFQGLKVDDAENAEAHDRMRKLKVTTVSDSSKLTSSSLSITIKKDEKAQEGGARKDPIEVQQLTVKGTGGSQFALQYSLGACPGSEVVASTLSGRRTDEGFKTARSVNTNVLPADSSILLVPDRVWREAEATFRRLAENREENRVSFFK